MWWCVPHLLFDSTTQWYWSCFRLICTTVTHVAVVTGRNTCCFVTDVMMGSTPTVWFHHSMIFFLFQVDMYYCHTCSRGDGEEYMFVLWRMWWWVPHILSDSTTQWYSSCFRLICTTVTHVAVVTGRNRCCFVTDVMMRSTPTVWFQHSMIFFLFQVDMYYCHTCSRGDREEYMLFCDGCDDGFHTYCLISPLNDILLVSGWYVLLSHM